MPLIALEGGDGVGKATQSKRLVDELRKVGYPVFLYSFPRYDTDVGRALRRHLHGDTVLAVAKRQEDEHDEDCDGRSHDLTKCLCDANGLLKSIDDPLAFQSMMLADKCDASSQMRGDLNRGAFVVCDRWVASSLVYGASDGLDHGWLERIHSPLPQADVTFYLKVSEEVAIGRRPVLRDRYEKDRGKQQIVAHNYDELARTRPGWFIIDGSRSVEEVGYAIWAILTTKLKHFFDA